MSPVRSGASLGPEFDRFSDQSKHYRFVGANPIRTILADLDVSDDAVITLARAVDSLAPTFCDGCEIEIADGTVSSIRHQGAGSVVSASDHHRLHVPVEIESIGDFPSCAGIVSVWWQDRTVSDRDAVIVELFLQGVAARILQEQAATLLSTAGRRAGQLALDAITSRRIGVAIGVLMTSDGLTEEEAEERLRATADEHGSSVFDQAFVIAQRTINGPSAGQSAVRRLGDGRP